MTKGAVGVDEVDEDVLDPLCDDVELPDDCWFVDVLVEVEPVTSVNVFEVELRD